MIAGDGTIYYSQAGGVGRITPDGMNNPAWLRITGASTIWGVILDPPRHRLYVASPSAATIYSVDLSADPPTSAPLLTGAGQPNGLTMGPDGALYYSDFAGGHVWRVDDAGMRTRVTTATIAGADGIAFYNGDLYVDGYSRGVLWRLTVSGGAETARAMVAAGLGSIDGLAFDATGAIYVTNAMGLVRLDPDGTNPAVLTALPGAAANIEFGAGALSCSDIYVATGSGLRRYEMGTAAGLDVPWHH